MASGKKLLLTKPRVSRFHVVPLSVDRNIPSPFVVAKISSVELTANDDTGLPCIPAWVHVVPLSLDRHTPPPSIPAKRVPEELNTNERTLPFVKPELIPVQLAPLSVERYAPSPDDPAKMYPEELIARVKKSLVVPVVRNPLLTCVQESPFTVLKFHTADQLLVPPAFLAFTRQ